jgi:23S rRNA (uracil-5-)-methyltransferase RumA
MKFGERLEARIDYLDEKGRGCGPISGSDIKRLVCARNVIPGERIEGGFAGRDKRRLRLSDVNVLEASPDRVRPECPHAGICGGCSLQHIRPERQTSLKLEMVNRMFAEEGLEARVAAIVASEAVFHHRNRMDYVFGPGGELGLKEPGRWDKPIDLTTCLMLSPDGFEAVKRVREWAKTTSHAPWDNRAHTGYLRYAVVREGKFTDERMLTLVTAPGELEKADELVERLKPLCTTVYHGINPLVTDLSLAKELHLLHGQEYLHEKIASLTYAISPNSFFQTNSAMAGKLFGRVREHVLAGPHERLLDLYCGAGFFSLALAKDVAATLGIELDAEAIAMANRNAEMNGVGNAVFRAEAAETLSWSIERPDIVIIDPPRSGLHPKVKRTLLANLPPRLVYVSCNPKALASDLKELLKSYTLEDIACFDLFPQTMHVETVAYLKKL